MPKHSVPFVSWLKSVKKAFTSLKSTALSSKDSTDDWESDATSLLGIDDQSSIDSPLDLSQACLSQFESRSLTQDYESIYRPLDPSRRQIRLLRLDRKSFPSKKRWPIDCYFEVVSLDDLPCFDALSYVWGLPESSENAVRVNGKRVKTRKNLEHALWYLVARNDVGMYLWVDAICINESDSEERASRVRLMTQIYSQAQTVRTWLGLAIPPVQNLFHKFGNRFEPEFLTQASSFENGAFEGFRYIMSCPWSRRLWIIQEVLLASNAVVHCGSNMIPWRDLLEGITLVSRTFVERRSSNKLSASGKQEYKFGSVLEEKITLSGEQLETVGQEIINCTLTTTHLFQADFYDL